MKIFPQILPIISLDSAPILIDIPNKNAMAVFSMLHRHEITSPEDGASLVSKLHGWLGVLKTNAYGLWIHSTDDTYTR